MPEGRGNLSGEGVVPPYQDPSGENVNTASLSRPGSVDVWPVTETHR